MTHNLVVIALAMPATGWLIGTALNAHRRGLARLERARLR